MAAIQNLVLTQLRSEIGKLTLDETFSARAKMNAVLLDELDSATDAWGVKVLCAPFHTRRARAPPERVPAPQVTRVEVRDIIPSKDITQAMEMQMAAERKKRANVLESEGRREAQVNDARGAADAVLLKAEAEAKRLRLVAEGEAASLAEISKGVNGDVDKALQFALMAKYWTTQAALAKSNNSKVLFFPSKATVPVTYEGLREMVGTE